jgi:hypothetical protein
MNRFSLGFTLVVALFLSGCAAPSMYYWGDYSTTLYHLKKTPSDESLLKHQQTLENIIEESKTKNLRVPPGVYAELGYIYLRQNKNELAIQYFRMEKELYPESAILMQRLENSALKKDKKPEEKTANPKQPEMKSEKQPK